MCEGGRSWDGWFKLWGDADEAVALAGDGLEEARVVGVFAEGVADFADGGVDAVLGVDEDFGVPEGAGDLVARDEAAAGGGEKDEELHGLAFETQGRAAAAQLEARAIQLKLAELDDAGGHGRKISWREVYRSRLQIQQHKKQGVAVTEVGGLPKLHPVFTSRSLSEWWEWRFSRGAAERAEGETTMNRTARFITVAAALATAMAAVSAGAQCLSGAGWKAAAKPAAWAAANGGARLMRAGYQPAEQDNQGNSAAAIVGMWHVKLVSQTITYFNNAPSLPFPEGVEFDAGYQQWHSDGTEMLNSGGRPPAISAFCMGVWEQTGPRTYKLNHFAISWTPGGMRTGPTSIVEVVTVSPNGKSFTGQFTITDYLETDGPSGSTLSKQDTISGPITGTRVEVNTPAEPIF